MRPCLRSETSHRFDSMNVASPDLLTLVEWAQQLASGDRCSAWEAWCASSSEAAWKWERITLAQDLLAGGLSAEDAEPELSVEEIAAYLEHRLTPLDGLRVEQACWQSTAQLAELLSAAGFIRQPSEVDVPSRLESRLLALAPPARARHVNGKPPKFRLAALTPQAASAANEPPAEAAASPAQPVTNKRPFAVRWQWPIFAAALLLAIAASGAVGWVAATWQRPRDRQESIARGPGDEIGPTDQDPPKPVIDDERGAPPPEARREDSSAAPSPPGPSTESPAPAVPVESLTPSKKGSEDPRPPKSPTRTPKYRPRIAPPTPELAFRSAQGLMLVDAGERGTWRAATHPLVLKEPTKLLSMAESWTTVEISGVGGLLWEGVAEAALTTLPEGGLEVRLVRGHLGIENLKAGAELHLLIADAAWTAHGAADDSLVIVVHDPVSPGILVSRGEVIVNDAPLAAGQVIRWLNGAPQSPQPLVPPPNPNATATTDAPTGPPAVNPWDLAWLDPPDENSRKQWRTLYGKLADRLVAVDDAGSELTKLVAATRDPRQAALLARWSVAVVAPSARPQQTWNFLVDRRAPVRAAGVKCLLELPPGDERLAAATSLLKDKLGAASAQRVNQWLIAAWKPGPPAANDALELVENLQHQELPMRQIAASLLELHMFPAFQQLGVSPPNYDAAGPASRRTAIQMEWRSALQQLYSPTRKFPVPLTPQQQKRLQNAAPGGT
jgi:hypothetical protein